MKLTVDPEFEALCPALEPEELRELEHSLETSEQLSPILYWTVDGKNLIIDGHNRHRILSSWGWRDEQFMVSELRFVTRLDAQEWIIRNQLGRRNLSTWQRTELNLRLEDVYKAQGLENKKKGGEVAGVGRPKDEKLLLNSAKAISPVDTRKEIAKKAGVSPDTVAKVKRIKEKATPEVKKAVAAGEISINAAYKTTVAEKPKEKQKAKTKGETQPKENIVSFTPAMEKPGRPELSLDYAKEVVMCLSLEDKIRLHEWIQYLPEVNELTN